MQLQRAEMSQLTAHINSNVYRTTNNNGNGELLELPENFNSKNINVDELPSFEY